jgi:hypothetical protein
VLVHGDLSRGERPEGEDLVQLTLRCRGQKLDELATRKITETEDVFDRCLVEIIPFGDWFVTQTLA